MQIGTQLRSCLMVGLVYLCQTLICYGKAPSKLSADLASDRGRIQRLAYCDQLIAHSPKNARYYLLRSYNEPFDLAARADIVRAVRLNHQIPEVRFWNGLYSNDSAVAVKELTAALELNPNYFDANFVLGQCLLGMDNSKAVQYFSRAIEISPYDNTIYSYRFLAYYEMGNVKHAYVDYKRALRRALWTSNSGTYDWTKAMCDDMASYSRVHPNVLTFDPDGLSILNELVANVDGIFTHETLLRLVESMSETIRRDPRVNDALFLRAQAFYLDRQLDKALSDLDHLLKYDGQTMPTCRLRGQVLMELNNQNAALPDLNRCIEMSPQTAVYYLARARCYFQLGAKQKYENDVLNCYLRSSMSLNEIRQKAKASQCFRADVRLLDPTERF